MIKLTTPPGLLLTTAFLAVNAAAAAQLAYIERSLPLAFAAGISAMACVGTALMKRWSQYLVYLITMAFVAKWSWSVYQGYITGYFAFQFGGLTIGLVKSLLPGLMMIVVSAVCSCLVNKHFRSQ